MMMNQSLQTDQIHNLYQQINKHEQQEAQMKKDFQNHLMEQNQNIEFFKNRQIELERLIVDIQAQKKLKYFDFIKAYAQRQEPIQMRDFEALEKEELEME